MSEGLFETFKDFSFQHSNFLKTPGLKASYSPTSDYLYVDIESSEPVLESTKLIEISGEEQLKTSTDENFEDEEDPDLGLFAILDIEMEGLDRIFFHEYGHFGASRDSLSANAVFLYDFIGGNNFEYFTRTFREDAYDNNQLVDILETEFARRQKMGYYRDLQAPIQEVCAEIWEACFSEDETVEIIGERVSELVSRHPDIQEEELRYDDLDQLMDLNDWSFYHTFPADSTQVKRFTRVFLITVIFLSVPILHSLDDDHDLGVLISITASLSLNTTSFCDYSREDNPMPPPARFLLLFRVVFAYFSMREPSEVREEHFSDIVQIYHEEGDRPSLRGGVELSEDVKENASTYKTLIDEGYDLIEDFQRETSAVEGGSTPSLSAFSEKNGNTLFALNQDGLSADAVTRSIYWNLFMQSLQRKSNLLVNNKYDKILRELQEKSSYDTFYEDAVGLYSYLEDNNLIDQIPSN